jgi:hypothetical protein
MNLILFAAKFDVPLAPAAPSSLEQRVAEAVAKFKTIHKANPV